MPKAIVRLILAISLAFIALAAPANAGRNAPVWNPPARYDHPYHGKLTVLRLPQWHVYQACKKLFAKHEVDANAYPGQKGCAINLSKSECLVVVIREKFVVTKPKDALRHEIAHCNGWPAHHPE